MRKKQMIFGGFNAHLIYVLWSMMCNPSKHRTLLEGMRSAIGNKGEVLYAKGSNIFYDENREKTATGMRPLERGDNQTLLKEAL